MDAFNLILECALDILWLVFVVACLVLAWYYGYFAGWRDCKEGKKKVKKELRKLERYY